MAKKKRKGAKKPNVQREDKAWLPQLVNGDGPITGAKLFGMAYTTLEHPWPICPNCDKAMELFLQLPLASLPRKLPFGPPSGVLQMFLCTFSHQCTKATWDQYADTCVVRIIPSGGAPISYEVSPVANPRPGRRIIGWKAETDLASGDDGFEEDFGFLDDDDLIMEIPGDDLPGYPLLGDKYLGWPRWAQGVSYPFCRKCGSKMIHLFQIDSTESQPYPLGDEGIGHITQCPKHPDILTFTWDLY